MLYLCKPDDVILPCKNCKNIVFRLTSYNPSFLSVFKGLYFLFEDKSLENKIILFSSETVMVRGSFSIFKRLFPSNMFHFLFENASRVHLCTPVVTMFLHHHLNLVIFRFEQLMPSARVWTVLRSNKQPVIKTFRWFINKIIVF